jgi:hypothetical protein
MFEKHQLGYYVLRYAPDALKEEFVNIGVVLVGEGGDAAFADVRFTRDWRRVLCLDPGADLETLQSLERDVRSRLKDAGSRSDILYRLQDLCSNLIQISPAKGCLGQEPAKELEILAKQYLESRAGGAVARVPGGRRRMVASMRSAFEREGLAQFLELEVPVTEFTRPGDPFKVDMAYTAKATGRDMIRMFHAVPLAQGIDGAKVLAFSYPQIAQGILEKRAAGSTLTAVIEDDLDRSDEAILFALATMERSRIEVAGLGEMPRLAEIARTELIG